MPTAAGLRRRRGGDDGDRGEHVAVELWQRDRIRVASLAALQELIGRIPQRRAIARGSSWLASHFAVDANPGKAAGFSHMHWLSAAVGRHAAEAGALRRPRLVPEGSASCFSTQKSDGAWRLEQGKFMNSEKNDVIDTCWPFSFCCGTKRCSC